MPFVSLKFKLSFFLSDCEWHICSQGVVTARCTHCFILSYNFNFFIHAIGEGTFFHQFWWHVHRDHTERNYQNTCARCGQFLALVCRLELSRAASRQVRRHTATKSISISRHLIIRRRLSLVLLSPQRSASHLPRRHMHLKGKTNVRCIA